MRIAWIILIVSFTLAGCGHGGSASGSADETESAESDRLSLDEALGSGIVEIGPLPVRTVERKVQATGVIAIPPTDLRSVHARIGGFVRDMKYLPGDYVRRGARLFSIEQPDIIAKQRELLETKANLDYARKDLARKEALREGGAASGGALEKALAENDYLKARYDGLRRELEITGVDVDALESDNRFQSRIPVYAPASGYVHEVFVNAGQMVHPENQLMDIADNGHLHLELNVFSRDVPAVREGQSVRFTVPGTQAWMEAEVVKLNPMLDSRSGTLQVHCHIEKADQDAVKAGMFATAVIDVEAVEVPGLPTDAVVKQGTRFYGYGESDGELVRVELANVIDYGEFLSFDAVPFERMVVKGAYYVE